jgi:hypothetical protein
MGGRVLMWRVALILLVGCGRHLNPEWCAVAGHSDPGCSAVIDARSGGCAVDDDCPGSVCLPTGGCADPKAVLHVAPDGAGTACTSELRCQLATAIGGALPDRHIIALAPATYPGVVAIDHSVQLVGRNATLQAATGDAVTVTNSAVAELDFVAITGAVAASGLSCAAGTTVTAHAVSIFGNQQGVASACKLTIERSTLSSNTEGAVVVTAGAIDIHDNFIVNNGSDAARVASVSIAAGVTGALAFNTVAYNNAKPNADPGVVCNAAAVTGTGNLVTDNTRKGSFGVSPQVVGACDFTRSYTAPGAGGNDLRWVDVTAGAPGFHLTSASSAALDQLACAAGEDFDGDPRPIGAACDYGADELKR